MESPAVAQFEENLRLLEELVAFDDRLMDFVITPLQQHRNRLASAKVPARLLPDNLIRVFQNIKSNESLKTYYQALYNQWLVLLVSYFGSAVRDLFVGAVTSAIRDRSRPAVLKAVLEAPVEEFADDREDVPAFLAELLASKKDISFQDMQSMGRAFSDYFGVTTERNGTVNDIIVAQAARHAIVHTAGIADRRLINQVKGARPRTLKNDLKLNDKLTFTPTEIRMAADAMRAYLRRLDDGIRATAI